LHYIPYIVLRDRGEVHGVILSMRVKETSQSEETIELESRMADKLMERDNKLE
jgi:hypothetical protein